MSGQYAGSTDVPVSRSRDELERTLGRYGATGFGYQMLDAGPSKPRVLIAFRLAGRAIRLDMPMPARSDKAFTHHSRGPRSLSAADDAWEQACRSRWRAVNLLVKAKLEAVALGVSTVEEEFLAATVIDGRTVWDVMREPVELAIANSTRLSIEAAGRQSG